MGSECLEHGFLCRHIQVLRQHINRVQGGNRAALANGVRSVMLQLSSCSCVVRSQRIKDSMRCQALQANGDAHACSGECVPCHTKGGRCSGGRRTWQ